MHILSYSFFQLKSAVTHLWPLWGDFYHLVTSKTKQHIFGKWYFIKFVNTYVVQITYFI